MPDVDGPADFEGCGPCGHGTGGSGIQVIGIQLHPYGKLCRHILKAKYGGYAADGFREGGGGAAVQHSGGLFGPVINGHLRFEEIVAEPRKGNPQGVHQRFGGNGVYSLNRRFMFPDHADNWRLSRLRGFFQFLFVSLNDPRLLFSHFVQQPEFLFQGFPLFYYIIGL